MTKHDPIARRAAVAERDRSQTPPLGSAIDPRAAVEPNQSDPSEDDFDNFDIAQLPTEMRQQLIAAELPLVPKHQLFDTNPPNKPLAAAPPRQPEAKVDATGDSRDIRVPGRTARKLVIAILVAMVALLGLALMGRKSTTPESTRSMSASAAHGPAPTTRASETPAATQTAPQAPAPAVKGAPILSQEQPERASAPKLPPPVSASRSKGTPASKPAPSSKAADSQPGSILRTVIAPPDE